MSPDDRNASRRSFLATGLALARASLVVGEASSQVPPPTTDDLRKSAPAGGNHPAIPDYKPAFFTPAEWAFINAACARLIPAEEHRPGALELGVPQYIDRQMGTPLADGAIWYMQGPFFDAAPEFGYQSQLTPKQQYRLGVKAIDALCQERLQKPFAELTPFASRRSTACSPTEYTRPADALLDHLAERRPRSPARQHLP